MNRLLIFGLGYCGRAVAEAVPDFAVMATVRLAVPPSNPPSPSASPSVTVSPALASAKKPAPGTPSPGGAELIPFAAADAAIAAATHILVTVPPDAAGDPVLRRHAVAIAAAPAVRWIGYLSSTVVYGDRGGGMVDERTAPLPSQPRGERRLGAERGWSGLAERCAIDLFRLGGIYGPGRSALDDVRAGTARRMIRPGHRFGRIHRDDIARAVAAAMRQDRPPGVRILNLVDDLPAESALVVEEAARLLGAVPPPAIRFDDALTGMSAMARSFWAERREVSARLTQESLGLRWRYPTYKEGLAAILREHRDRP
jgi:nucleoside-diphosphate-sugar epimerase